MHLLELAVQGVRGFPAQSRLTFKPGLIALRPSGDPPPLSALLMALFYADGRGGDSELIAPGQSSAKALVTFLGNDSETYRIGKKLGGSGALQRLDPSRKFQTVSDSAGEIGQFLKGQLGLPSKSTFEQLLILKASHLPSRAGSAKKSPTTRPTARPQNVSSNLMFSQSSVSRLPTGSRGEVERRMAELEAEMARVREVEELQFRQQGIASELFEIETKEKEAERLRAEAAEAERACAAAPTPKSLGLAADIFERVRHYPEYVRKRDASILRLRGINVEKEGYRQCRVCGGYHIGGDHVERWDEQEPEPPTVPRLHKDGRFWAGVASGVVLLVLSLFLPGSWHYLGLLDIPAFAYAAYFALLNVEEWQAADVIIHKHQVRKAMEQKVLSDFAAEAGPVQAAMKILEVDRPDQVVETLSKGAPLMKDLEEAQRRLAAAVNAPGFANLASRRDALRREEKELEAQLLKKGQYLRDVHEVERDLYQLKQSLNSDFSDAGAAASVSAPLADAGESSSTVEREDPFPSVLERATDLFNAQLSTLAASLRERAGQYLVALTERQLHAIDFDKNGKATLTGANGRVAAAELPARELDLAYLGVRLTIAERFVSSAKLPFIIESGLDATDPSKHALLCKMIKYLGSQSQVVQLTQCEGLAGLADAALSV